MTTVAPPRGFGAILADLADPPQGDYIDGWVPLPHQEWPAGDWRYALFMAGRSAGKTDTGAHYVDRYARHHPGARIAIIAPTLGDARSTCIRGVSGLLAANPTIRWVASPDGIAYWPNGSQARIFGAYTPQDPDRLRGPQHHLVWGDELAAWPRLEEVWEQMDFGLRLGPRPHAIFTTTPRPRNRIRRLVKDPTVPVMRATTDQNPHLNQLVRDTLNTTYAGTAFGRQELLGELIDDDQDVVIPWGWIDRLRTTTRPPLPPDIPTEHHTADAPWARRAATYPAGTLTPVELGVDVGAGGDESVIIERRGPLPCRIWTDQQPDTMRVVGLVIQAIRETGATAVKIDTIGIGHGVVDRLQELRREGAHRARIIGVNVGAASRRPDRFPRLRDELWWEVGRKLTEDGGWDLAGITDTVADQLSSPRFTLDSAGRVKIEPKDETRSSLGRSPDHADALLLAFHHGVARTPTITTYQ